MTELAIRKAIQKSDALVLVVSKNSIDRFWVKLELEIAMELGKRIVFIIIDDVWASRSIELTNGIKRYSELDFTEWQLQNSYDIALLRFLEEV